MSERFHEFGAELPEAERACALAALGVLAGWRTRVRTAPTPESLAAEIRSRTSPSGQVIWRFSHLLPISARMLALAWRSYLHSGARGNVRIKIEADPARIDLDWLREQLSRPEVGARSVTISRSLGEDERGARRDRGKPTGSYGVPQPSGGGGDGDPGPAPDVVVFRIRRLPPRPAGRKKGHKTPQPRFLQARLHDHTDPEHPRQVHTLRRGGSYRVNVRIGLPDEAWTAVEEPFPVPPEPPEPEGHRLTVVFWEPRVSPEPQVETLWLPPKGNSRAVSFSFKLSEEVGAIAARITVLHHNRVLQTGLLRASSIRVHTFRLDATPRTRLEGLSARSQFDVALVLNHDDEGTPRMTAAAGDQAAVISLDGGALTKLTEYLSKRISKIARAPEQYSTLSSPGTVELLRALAQKGGALHDYLRRHTRLGILSEARRIHLTSAKAESFFPVELLYRFDPPDETAGLCPNAAVALQTGECPGGCPADKRQHVCPLGFWGLSRIIERYAHTPEHDEIGRDFRLQSELLGRKPLPLSGRSLLAASGRASEVKKEAVDELHQALAQRGSAARVTSWEEWIEHVRMDRPALLVLIPHHEQIDGDEFLEIGEGDRLQSELVREEHVSREEDLSPIVLLLGCETNLARIAFDNLVIRFRDRGAAIVVSTIATILGRHASPAAARLIELLDEEAREGNSTFGEVMLRLRQSLVAEETPMALGLTAYGDADWVLTRVE